MTLRETTFSLDLPKLMVAAIFVSGMFSLNAPSIFALYEQVAQAGNTEAEFATGQVYQTGHGVKADATLATTWYRAAALNGLATAQTSPRFAYQTGMGIPQDYAAASFWFSRAAAQAGPGGEMALDYLYLLGQGDSIRSTSWFCFVFKGRCAEFRANLFGAGLLLHSST